MSPGDYLIWYAVFACATQLAMASTKLLSREATLFVNNVRLPDTHAGYKVIRTDRGYLQLQGTCSSLYRWQASPQNLVKGRCPTRCAQSCTTEIQYSSEVFGQELPTHVAACAKRTVDATDGDVGYTATWLEPTRVGETSAFFSVVMERPRRVSYVVLRGDPSVNVSRVDLRAYSMDKKLLHHAHTLASDPEGDKSGHAWKDMSSEGLLVDLTTVSDPMAELRLTVTNDGCAAGAKAEGLCKFRLRDISAFAEPCYDDLVLDLGAVHDISHVDYGVYSTAAGHMAASFSVDGLQYYGRTAVPARDKSYLTSGTLKPTKSGLLPARYVRFRFQPPPGTGTKPTIVSLAVHGQTLTPNSDGKKECKDDSACSVAPLCFKPDQCKCLSSLAGVPCAGVSQAGKPSDCGLPPSSPARAANCAKWWAVEGRGVPSTGLRPPCDCAEPMPCPFDCHDHGKCNRTSGVCACQRPTPTATGHVGDDCSIGIPKLGPDLKNGETDITATQSVSVRVNGAAHKFGGRLVDGKTGPLWQSDNICNPDNWVNRGRSQYYGHNLLLGACALGLCTASCECGQHTIRDPKGYAVYTCSHPTSKITNGNTNDGTFIKYDGASRTVWLEIRLPSPSALGWVLVKGFFNGATLLLVDGSGGVREVTTELRTDTTWAPYQVFNVSGLGNFEVHAIRIEHESKGGGKTNAACYAGDGGECMDINVQEVAAFARGYDCFEDIELDLGKVFDISYVDVDVYHRGIERMEVQTALAPGGYSREHTTALDLAKKERGYLVDSEMAMFWPTRRAARLLRLRVWYNHKISAQDIRVWGVPVTQGVATKCPNNCGSHGQCKDTGCVCAKGFGGLDCTNVLCGDGGGGGCLHNGTCAMGVCQCRPGFYGKHCEKRIGCPQGCWGRGKCVEGRCVCTPPYGGSDCRYTMVTLSKTTKPVGFIDLAIYPRVPFIPDVSKAIGGAVTAGLCKDVTKPFWCGVVREEVRVSTNKIQPTTTQCASSFGACLGSGVGGWGEREVLQTEESYSGLKNMVIANGTALRVVEVKASTNQKDAEKVLTESRQVGWCSGWRAECTDDQCWDHVTLELALTPNGDAPIVGSMRTAIQQKQMRSRVAEVQYLYSVDGKQWTPLPTATNPNEWPIIPTPYFGVEVEISPVVRARYLRISQRLPRGTKGGKVCVHRFRAWGAHGPFGPLPPRHHRPQTGNEWTLNLDHDAQPVTLQRMLGINMIWGFGGASYSNLQGGWVDGKATLKWGPSRYSEAFQSHARNYHNWNWDAISPRVPQDYSVMGCQKGTSQHWWLDWFREYRGVRTAGFKEVIASIQFDEQFPLSDWKDPPTAYDAAYAYGYAFAWHFGPSHGTGDVRVMEVGNEPWDVPHEIYSAILLGMARGAKAADPAMRVLPGCLNMKELVSVLNSTHVEVIDGLNLHVYSWRLHDGGVRGGMGGRSGVHPEHRASIFRVLSRYVRFRDENLPGLPLLVTEYGWDSEGGGETCEPGHMPECVTERAQALYLVRGLLMLSRWGMQRASVFFYGNTDGVGGNKGGRQVFSRSGVTGSKAAGFKPKLSLGVLEGLMQSLGHLVFLAAIQETDHAWVYLYGSCQREAKNGDDCGVVATHLIAWRPIPGASTSAVDVTVSLPAIYFGLSKASKDTRVAITERLTFVPTLTRVSVTGVTTKVVDTDGMLKLDLKKVGTSPSAFALATHVTSTLPNEGCEGVTCVNGGVCARGECVCREGFKGPRCAQKRCPNECWDRGLCGADGKCECEAWINQEAQVNSPKVKAGTKAEILKHSAWVYWDEQSSCKLARCPLDCSGHGRCDTSTTWADGVLGAAFCDCNEGYTGKRCEYMACPNHCRGSYHGRCLPSVKNATCECDLSGLALTDHPGMLRGDCSWHPDHYETNLFDKRCPGPRQHKPQIACPQRKGGFTCTKTVGQCLYQTDYPHPTTPSTTPTTTPKSSGSTKEQSTQQKGDGHSHGWVMEGVEAQKLPVTVVQSTGGAQGHRKVTDGSRFTRWEATNACTPDAKARGNAALSSPKTDKGEDCVHWIELRVPPSPSGSPTLVGAITIWFYEYDANEADINEGVAAMIIQTRSGDDQPWANAAVYEPAIKHNVDVEFTPARPMSSLRVVFFAKREGNGHAKKIKALLYECNVWDRHGPHGPMPPPRVQTPSIFPNPIPTLGQLLGVNGIWGWGTGAYSDMSIRFGSKQRATEMAKAFSHARNYHNWHWDVADPDSKPKFHRMAQAGHDGALYQDWLNWDREYGTWARAGLEVQTSIQFTGEMFPHSTWDDAYNAGYHYGLRYGRHFGPTFGTGDVSTVEVGNEPVEFVDTGEYAEVVLGMARGLKEGDPALRVLPGVIYPFERSLRALNRSHFRYLDGFNTHIYSWTNHPRGVVGTFPESKVSIFREILQIIRFRDANIQSMPIYVTEYGWDSPGGGEVCYHQMTRCVSEWDQAVYLVRGLLMLSRLSMQRATQFFYANTDGKGDKKGGELVFTRSGVTGSKAAGFKPKLSLPVLEGLIAAVSHIVFLDVLVENDQAWVHLYGTYTNPGGAARETDGGYEVTPTHIIAWRPITGEDKSTVSVDIPFSSSPWLKSNYALAMGLGRLSLVPTRQAMVVTRSGSGLARAGSKAWTPTPGSLASGPLTWKKLTVSAVPVIVEMKVRLSPPSALSANRNHAWTKLKPRGSCPTVCGAAASVLSGDVRCVAEDVGLGSVEVVSELEAVMCASAAKPAPLTTRCPPQPLCPLDVGLTTTAKVCGQGALAAQRSFEKTVLAASGASQGTFKYCDGSGGARRRLGSGGNKVNYRLFFPTPSNASGAKTTMTGAAFANTLLQQLKVTDKTNFGTATVAEVKAELARTFSWGKSAPICPRRCGLPSQRVAGTVVCRDNYGELAKSSSACGAQAPDAPTSNCLATSPCVAHKWHPVPARCPHTPCGDGTTTRSSLQGTVVCKNNYDVIVEDKSCKASSKPAPPSTNCACVSTTAATTSPGGKGSTSAAISPGKGSTSAGISPTKPTPAKNTTPSTKTATATTKITAPTTKTTTPQRATINTQAQNDPDSAIGVDMGVVVGSSVASVVVVAAVVVAIVVGVFCAKAKRKVTASVTPKHDGTDDTRKKRQQAWQS